MPGTNQFFPRIRGNSLIQAKSEEGERRGRREVEDGAKSWNPKEVGENSGRTNRGKHKERDFDRSDYRRRDNELKRCFEGLRACTSVL